MKRFLALIMAVMMILAMTACGAPAETPATDAPGKTEGTYKLGFVLGSREHAFYCSIEEGILAAAKDLGFEAVVLESDLNGAIASERIETLVVDGCDAISLSVNDPTGCTPAIVAADAEGVPMFAFDCTSSETDVIKSFVGTDNYKGGVVGGEATIKYLEDNGLTSGATIGIIGYPEPQSCIDRENGWFSVVNEYKDKYNLNIVNIGNYKGDASTAESLMNDALIAYPDMACIFTVGDPACVGALAAIKAAGASTTMIGFDANPEAHEAILDPENGKIWFADVAQDPYQIGYQISEQMMNYLKNGSAEKTVMISPYLVDASNAIGAATTPETPAADDKLDGTGLKLGFVLGSREHAFYCSIEEGILAAAKDLGFEAVVLESDLNGAIASERIETLVVDGCDAISLSVNDPTGCTPAIVAADAEGVPMFAFDCTSSETDVIKSFVGTDNYKGGVVGGEATIKYLEDNGLTSGATIGIIGYPEPQSCIDRENGWFSVVNEYKDKYNLNIVNIGNYKGDASTAESLMNDALIAYPDMACIFTVGDPACVGALAAIKAAGASTTMIGFDANPEAHEAILDPENGKIWFADVAQDPYQIGYQISEQMVSFLTRGTAEKTVMISPYLVDASNAVAP